MKNNTNSILNKIGDVNSEIVIINRKLESVESLYDKLQLGLKDEIAFRQNVEKKTFQINETFHNKFNTLVKSLDDLNSLVNKKTETIQNKFNEEIQKNSETSNKDSEGIFKLVKETEDKLRNLNSEFNLYKSENNSKLFQLDEVINLEMRDIKKDISNNNLKLEILEKKINENFSSLQNEMASVVKDITIIKNDLEMIKNFKENTILNFKDISEEFLKNENTFNKVKNKIYIQISEFESKLNLYEQTFSLQNDNFLNIKKDVMTQIYENNLSINNKLQIFNDKFLEKLESNDKMMINFQHSLIDENDKFTSYIGEKVDDYHKNLKKLLGYTNEDMDLIKEKTRSLEEMIKTLRNEFFHNLNEVEEFLIKKYENIYRSMSTGRN